MLEGGCAWSVVLTGEQLNSASGAGETPWATPVVGLIAGEERRRESRERLVEVGKAALNVEMWQGSPAKFKAQDFGRGLSDRKFEFTSTLRAKTEVFAYHRMGVGRPGSTWENVTQFNYRAAGAQFLREFSDWTPGAPAFAFATPGGGMYGAVRGPSMGEIMFNAVHEGRASSRGGGAQRHGLPPEGRGHMVFRPSKRWRNTNRAWKNKDAKQKQETLDHFALKVDQLRTMALGGDKVTSTGGAEIKQSKKGLGFTETAARRQKRSKFMNPHSILSKDASEGPVLSDAMRENVHKELEAEVRKDKGSTHRARHNLGGVATV